MSAAAVDPEQLAALIDGRLDGWERIQVLEQLAASEEFFQVYMDAVLVVRELGLLPRSASDV